MKTTRFTMDVTETDRERFDELKKRGEYTTIAQAIREAVKLALRTMPKKEASAEHDPW